MSFFFIILVIEVVFVIMAFLIEIISFFDFAIYNFLCESSEISELVCLKKKMVKFVFSFYERNFRDNIANEE